MKSKPVILAFDLRDARCFSSVCATFDANVWRQVDDDVFDGVVRAISAAACRSLEGLVSPLDMTLITCIPHEWLVSGSGLDANICLVAFSSDVLGVARKHYRVDLLNDETYGCQVERQGLIKAGWVSLGFDLCDDMLSTSYLYTDTESGLIQQAKDWKMLNRFGLFDSDLAANKFLDACPRFCPEHEPFSPVEILVERIPGV